MTIYKKHTRLILAFVLTLAMIFSLTPMLPDNDVQADSEGVTVEYRTGSTITSSQTYNMSDLDSMATSTGISDQKYLAWDGSKYVVIQSDYGISLLDLVDLDSLPSGWTIEVTNGTDTRSFGYQDIQNGNFYGESTSTIGITTGSVNVKPILALSSGTGDISTKAENVDVTDYDDANLKVLVGLPSASSNFNSDYIKNNSNISKYISGVTKITVVKPGSLSNFKVYSQIGDQGQKTLVKTFSEKELNNLAHTDKVLGFLQKGGTWSVHGTNKYIPIEELFEAAGTIFNADDKIKPMASDGFSTTQSYENIQANKYFYGGTTLNGKDISNPKEVGAVLAINWIGSVTLNTGTAQTNLNAMDWSKPNTNGRFYMGVSAENYNAESAAGNRLITAPVEITIIKDKADAISNKDVTISKSTYTATGNQIKPAVTVRSSGVTLKSGTDYTVSYGTNKLGKGTVTITGKGNFTGTVTKDIKINPRGTSIKSIKVGKKKATIKWKKAKDAVTGYQIAYKKKGTKKYKVVTVKGVKKTSKVIKKLAKNKKYQFKIRTYKTDGKTKYYSSYSKVKTSKKIKK